MYKIAYKKIKLYIFVDEPATIERFCMWGGGDLKPIAIILLFCSDTLNLLKNNTTSQFSNGNANIDIY